MSVHHIITSAYGFVLDSDVVERLQDEDWLTNQENLERFVARWPEVAVVAAGSHMNGPVRYALVVKSTVEDQSDLEGFFDPDPRGTRMIPVAELMPLHDALAAIHGMAGYRGSWPTGWLIGGLWS